MGCIWGERNIQWSLALDVRWACIYFGDLQHFGIYVLIALEQSTLFQKRKHLQVAFCIMFATKFAMSTLVFPPHDTQNRPRNGHLATPAARRLPRTAPKFVIGAQPNPRVSNGECVGLCYCGRRRRRL